MNPILQKKIDELNNSNKFECWYLVKQDTKFSGLCYLVSFLKDYQQSTNPIPSNLEQYIEHRAIKENESNPSLKITPVHRALRVAAFFGLIEMESNYQSAIITDTFEEIVKRCEGKFEETSSYQDIIQRQIEKLFVSSSIDKEFEGIRNEYRLYPTMLLYKILIELGRSTGDYSICMTEYRYFVATTKKHEDFIDTLVLIKLLRESTLPNISEKFEQFKNKFDNRLILALQQLPTLTIHNERITLNPDKIDEVALKVFNFEKNPKAFNTNNYIDFLGSTKSLFEIDHFNKNITNENKVCSVTAKYNSSDNTAGQNILLYGAPGVGKSHLIENEYCKDYSRIERVVFHPDYMNTDFVGQILPVRNGVDQSINYDFKPGPFTRILKKAFDEPSKHYYLIIEEINRGNAPAIFGEIFQLLDRDHTGKSKYAISNHDIALEVHQNSHQVIKIPANLTLLATMNTADQNVFTLDTAFQRRWQMRMIANDIDKCNFKDIPILDTKVSWERFNKVINNIILNSSQTNLSTEDKRLGAYFISEDVLHQKISDPNQHIYFSEKVLKYLWDDVFKFNRNDLFNERYSSLEDIIDTFAINTGPDRFQVFNSDISSLLTQNSEYQLP